MSDEEFEAMTTPAERAEMQKNLSPLERALLVRQLEDGQTMNLIDTGKEEQ